MCTPEPSAPRYSGAYPAHDTGSRHTHRYQGHLGVLATHDLGPQANILVSPRVLKTVVAMLEKLWRGNYASLAPALAQLSRPTPHQPVSTIRRLLPTPI